MPSHVGLIMDVNSRATVKAVVENSPAAQGGFKPGDEIQSLQGQPMISIADMQWVLEHTGEKATLKAIVKRDSKVKQLTLNLTKGWRRTGAFVWRHLVWDIRASKLGIAYLAEVDAATRKKLGIDANKMCLQVGSSVMNGWFINNVGGHREALKSGIRPKDIIVAVDGKTDLASQTFFLAYVMQKKLGKEIELTILRGGERIKFKYQIP